MAQREINEPQLSAHGYDEWYSIISAKHRGWQIAYDAQTPPDPIHSYQFDRMALVSCRVWACAGTHQPDLYDTGEVGILVIHGGSETVSINDMTMTLATGDAVIWDTSSTASFEVPDFVDKSTIFLARALVESWFPRLSERIGTKRISAEKTGGLRSLIRAIDETPQNVLAAQSSTALENALRELTYVTLAALWQGTELDPTLLSRPEVLWGRALEYVEDRLTERVTAEMLAAHLALSVRSVYQLFADHGTSVQRFIKARRLERAREDLLKSPGHLTVATVAQRCGFPDQSSFTKAFRRQFGVPPASFVRESKATETASHTPDRFKTDASSGVELVAANAT